MYAKTNKQVILWYGQGKTVVIQNAKENIEPLPIYLEKII